MYDWAISNGYHTKQQFTYSGGLTENDNAKYMWGYNNTCAMKSYAAAKNLTSGIISFVDNYNVSVESASSWYLPSIKEMHLVRSASVKGKVESLGGDSLSKPYYYTSSEENDASYVPYVNFSNGALQDKYKTTIDNVFAIFAF